MDVGDWKSEVKLVGEDGAAGVYHWYAYNHDNAIYTQYLFERL